jgi:hypothetical protein
LRGAALRTPGIMVPGVHGEALNVLQTFDAGTVVLPLIVFGVDRVTGIQSGDGVTQLRDNVAYLSRIASAPQVTIDHDFGDGVVRRAVGRMRSDPFEGERLMSNPPAVRVSVAFSIPGAFWQDADTVQTPVYALTSGASQELTVFAGATAPMDELVIMFGPGLNPQLLQGTQRMFVYNGQLTAGQALYVNTATWELTGVGFTPDYSKIRYEPRARWFELDPSAGTPVVRLVHSGGGTMQLQITGRRKYWTGA